MSRKKTAKTWCQRIGVSKDHLVGMICGMNIGGLVGEDYIEPIAEKIAEDVAEDIYQTADRENWNSCDVKMAIGRVLCRRLRIGV